MKIRKLVESVSWLILFSVIIKNNYLKIALLRTLNMLNKVDPINERDCVFHELIEECRHASPGARLSRVLRYKLEKYPVETRRDIVNRIKVGCAPLFIACKKGQTDIVDYLISVCHADIEQKGLYEVQEDRSTHIVTPLWCAAVSGKIAVVEVLLKYNANINAVSDTGSTPVRSACFMTHYEIVKYLVEHGANINRPNYNGGTCLINSVQSAPLCEFLLKNGADVNARDIQNKTALHYAIQEHRLETTKLLLKNGADYTARSRHGDDALRMACLKGANIIFEYLTANICYSPEELANAHELMGATYLDEQNELVLAKRQWKKALAIRENYGLVPKQPVMPLLECYKYQKEFETLEELESLSTDFDLIRIQSLLMTERILGPHHKDTIFRLMYRGASYADVMRYQQCIDLWRRALEIRVEKDSIIYTDTCFTAQALVRLMIDYHGISTLHKEENAQQRFHDVIATFKLLTENITEISQLLKIKPIYKRQCDFFDKILKCITHLIYLMLATTTTEEDKALVQQLVSDLIRKNIKCAVQNDSLLHLAVSKLNTIRSNYFMDEDPIMIFPDEKVVKYLLECGAPVNARNDLGWSPLLLATLSYNYTEEIIRLLLDHGAHIDQPNVTGKTPFEAIFEVSKKTASDIHILNYITLKCLCASVIIKSRIPYKNQIPRTLENFIILHTPKS